MSVIVGLNTDKGAVQNRNIELVTWKNYSAGIASEFLIPAANIDSTALSLFNKVKQRQTDLATLGGNVGLGSTCYSSDTSYLTTTYGDLVSGVGTALAVDLGIVGVGTTQVVAFGQIKFDTFEALSYPKIESGTLDVTADDPRSGAAYVSITGSNLGIGASSRYLRGAGSNAGNVFSLENTCHTAIASSITSVKAQYTSESAGMSTYVSAVNLVKTQKSQNQFQAWSWGRKINENTGTATSITSTISVLEDPNYGGPY